MNPIRFTASTSWADAIAGLDAKVKLEVYDAIFGYAGTGVPPQLTPLAKVAFAFIKADMDCAQAKKQRISEARAKAGRIAGKSKRSNKEKPA